MKMQMNARWFLLLLFVSTSSCSAGRLRADERTAAKSALSFKQTDVGLQIAVGEQSVAEYVFGDETIPRPYFRHLRTRSGVQVTRNHPPVKGRDLEDHDTMHPGVWLAFADLNGADFWRNKGQVKHQRFVQEPQAKSDTGSFTSLNHYVAQGRTMCTETCEIKLKVRADGYLLDWQSTFESTEGLTFGDQEEMGLGVRVATPLAVEKGGEIRDSEDRKNGAQVWGKQAKWCQYSAVLDGKRVGIVVMPSPKNFRPSWYHARDYGLLVANPFGRNAFTKGEVSQVTVKPGDKFQLRFGLLVYETAAVSPLEIAQIYRDYIEE